MRFASWRDGDLRFPSTQIALQAHPLTVCAHAHTRGPRSHGLEQDIRTGVNTWTEEMESMYGLPPGVFGRTRTAFENLVHPDDRAEVTKLVDRALKTGNPTAGEWRVI